MSDAQDDQHKALEDEIKLKLGRNLLNAQLVEHLLKLLLARVEVSALPGQMEAALASREELVKTQTAGHIKNQYLDAVLIDSGEQKEAESDPSHMSFKFKFSMSDEDGKKLRADLDIFVKERNDLVHHFLPRIHPKTEAALRDAIAYLDSQNKIFLRAHSILKLQIDCFVKATELLSNFVASDNWPTGVDAEWVVGKPLPELMAAYAQVAQVAQAKNGWINLADVGRVAWKELPDEVKELKKRYGYSTLKQLANAVRQFEVRDEPLPNGRFRTQYRLKAGTD
jgi:hypothetical protein